MCWTLMETRELGLRRWGRMKGLAEEMEDSSREKGGRRTEENGGRCD